MNLDWQRRVLTGLVALGAAVAVPATASAFCGFYVGGAGAEMYNDATQVVLLRDGTKTVLSMQNRYEGPLDNFAMVVPVPQVLLEDNVKTLDKGIFDKVDTLTSPRLVEYWEQDPCSPYNWAEDDFASAGGGNNADGDPSPPGEVVVEAQFAVGEYEISVLSTNDGAALENWLDDNEYTIPDGSAPYFEPYVQAGMYFFVAKVNADEVTFEDGKAVLSPLRFHYDSDEFQLPVRLGMINSAGKQDLLVYILGREQRYEVANMPNVTIPTNIEVVNGVRDDFGGFYRALFSRTLDENKGAAVTEYSWGATNCDPCPGPVTLQPEDLTTLGLDVIQDEDYWSWIITRIHVQYDKDEVGEDLVFRKANPIVGGREHVQENGELEEGAVESDFNNFQARYIIRHRWEDDVDCEEPQYGIWGADPNSENPWGQPPVTSNPSPNTSGNDVFVDNSSTPVEQLVEEDIPEIGVIAGAAGPDAGPKTEPGACSAASPSSTIGGAGFLALLGFIGFGVRRRRRN